MNTASCEEGCGESSESKVDKFSNLPDPIVHQILSFLTITDLTRVGCVSKRCREYYISTPSLDFDEFSDPITSSCYKRLKLLNSLDRFFIHRGDNKIERFRIRWVRHRCFYEKTACICDYNEKSRMVAWIRNAVRCNVEVLDLETDLFEEKPFTFPSCIYFCGSLRSLSVEMNCAIRTPSFPFSSNLKKLELKNVKILDEGFFEWISCCCKCIKDLSLSDVYGTKIVAIESSSMETFYFEGLNQIDIYHLNVSGENLKTIGIDFRFDLPSSKSINIFAPNLKSLYWGGDSTNLSNLGELLCLEEVGFYFDIEEDDSDKCDEISGTRGINFLILKEKTIKALFRKGSMPVLFGDIWYLHMHVGSFIDDRVPAVAFLLRGLPKLSTLYIESIGPPYCFHPKANTSGFDMGYWKLQSLAFTFQLKEVTIELPNGSNGIEFVKYLLEHAPNLEKMVLICLPQHSNAKKELEKSNAISDATIVFQENKKREPKLLF